jgi:hypothetical protein
LVSIYVTAKQAQTQGKKKKFSENSKIMLLRYGKMVQFLL